MKYNIIIILLLFLAISISGCVSEKEPTSADNQFRVESASMEPALKEGDMVTVERVDFSEIQVGNIVMIKPTVGRQQPLLFTRIVSIDRGKGTFTAKADANPISNNWEKDARFQIIVGKVVDK